MPKLRGRKWHFNVDDNLTLCGIRNPRFCLPVDIYVDPEPDLCNACRKAVVRARRNKLSSLVSEREALLRRGFELTASIKAIQKLVSDELEIDWGDGSIDRFNAASGDKAHTYPAAGVYSVSVKTGAPKRRGRGAK